MFHENLVLHPKEEEEEEDLFLSGTQATTKTTTTRANYTQGKSGLLKKLNERKRRRKRPTDTQK